MHPWSGPTVLGRRLCFGLDCAQSTTFAVRWYHETGGAGDKDRHRHQGLCSRCCYCMEQTTSWHSNLYVHCSDICTETENFLCQPAHIWECFFFILRGRNWLIIIIIKHNSTQLPAAWLSESHESERLSPPTEPSSRNHKLSSDEMFRVKRLNFVVRQNNKGPRGSPCSVPSSDNNRWSPLWSRDHGLETRVHSSSFCPGLGLGLKNSWWPRSRSWSRDLKTQTFCLGLKTACLVPTPVARLP